MARRATRPQVLAAPVALQARVIDHGGRMVEVTLVRSPSVPAFEVVMRVAAHV